MAASRPQLSARVPFVISYGMKILQVFNSYQQFGGEEASVEQIRRILRLHHEVEVFSGSTRVFLGATINKIQAPLKAVWNWRVFEQLRRLQIARRFDVWLVHNVFPALSPAVYDAARVVGAPIVQYLHNYRFGCVNGFVLNHGEPCARCITETFSRLCRPAVGTKVDSLVRRWGFLCLGCEPSAS